MSEIEEKQIKDTLLTTLRRITGFRGMSENIVQVDTAEDGRFVIEISSNQMFDNMAAAAAIMQHAPGVHSKHGKQAQALVRGTADELSMALEGKAFQETLKTQFELHPATPGRGRR